MADAVIARLKQSHFQYSCENLKYPHAGHMAGHPGIAPVWHTANKRPISGGILVSGGTMEGNALSSMDATPKVLEFLRKSLK